MLGSSVAWRSTALFLFIGAAEIHLHELAHAVTGVAIGLRPIVLYPDHVQAWGTEPNLELLGKYAVVAAAGPLLSLVLAGVALLLHRSLRDHARPEVRLALVWLAFFGFLGAVGYLILTPFGGDTYIIAQALHLPPLGRWAAFGAGIYAMTRVAGPLLAQLGPLAPSPELLASSSARMRYVRDVAVIPWLVFLALSLAVQFPPKSPWGLAAVVGLGLPLVSAASDVRRRDDLKSEGQTWNSGLLPWMVLAGYVALAVLDRFVLHDRLTVAG